MTWLWTSLIVIGGAMILVAVWPSIRRRAESEPVTESEPPPGTGDDHKPEGL